MSSRPTATKRPNPIVGTTQSKVVGVLALAALALSFAVALKTSNFGAAFLAFALGALGLILVLLDLSCITLGTQSPFCNPWAWVKSVLIGLVLVGAILMSISALTASAPVPAPLTAFAAQGPRGNTVVAALPQ